MMYACVCYSSLFKCVTKYRLYKQIEPLHSTGVPKLTPGYATVGKGLLLHATIFLLSF